MATLRTRDGMRSAWRGPCLLGLCVALSAGSFSPNAVAQSDSQRAASRAAAEAGYRAFQEGRYQEAVDYFERAEHIMHAPTLLLHLARSLAKLGYYVRAREAYIKVTREQLPAGAPPAFVAAQTSAKSEIDEVSKKIGNLTIEVTGAPREALRVTVDGQPMPAEIVGLPAPIDPGNHAVAVSAEGYQPTQGAVSVQEGGSGKLTLVLRADPNAPAATPPVVAGPSSAPSATPAQPSTAQLSAGTDSTVAGGPKSAEDRGRGLQIGGYVGVGLGVVGVGLGTLFLIQRGSTQSDADDIWNACAAEGGSDVCNDPEARKKSKDLDDDAAGKGTLAVISYAAGGIAAAVGVTLLVLNGSKESSSARVEPYFTGNSLGIAGQF